MNKSQYFISQALLTLMREKPYEKISVMDIARRAYVSRTTLYNHFQDKADILNLLIEKAMLPVCRLGLPRTEQSYNDYLAVYLGTLRESRELFLQLRSSGVLDLVPAYLAKNLLATLQQAPDEIKLQLPRELELFCSYEANLTFYSAFWFLNNDSDRSDVLLAQIISSTRRIGLEPSTVTDDYIRPQEDPSARLYSSDARAAATKQQLYDALNKLLETHTPEQISISELAQTAGVARCSFYRHYSDIDSLMEEQLQIIYAEVIRQLPSIGRLIGYGPSIEASLRGYSRYKALFKALVGGDYELLVMNAYRSSFDILEWRRPYIKKYEPTDSYAMEYYRWFMAVEHMIPVMLYYRRNDEPDITVYSALMQEYRYYPFK